MCLRNVDRHTGGLCPCPLFCTLHDPVIPSLQGHHSHFHPVASFSLRWSTCMSWLPRFLQIPPFMTPFGSPLSQKKVSRCPWCWRPRVFLFWEFCLHNVEKASSFISGRVPSSYLFPQHWFHALKYIMFEAVIWPGNQARNEVNLSPLHY